MSQKTRAIDRRFGFFLAVLTFLVVVLAVWTNAAATTNARMAAHALQVESMAQAALRLAIDAETGQRGFLLTGDPAFLDPFHAAQAAHSVQLRALRDAVADDPEQAVRVDQLRAMLDAKLAELTETLRLEATGDRALALSMVKNKNGKRLMDEARAKVAALTRVEEALVAARQRRADVLRGVASVLTTAGLVALATMAALQWRQMRHAVVVQRVQIASLGAEVDARTADVEREVLRLQALLADLSHRVGNNLAMVASMLGLQMRDTQDATAKAALKTAVARIQAVGTGLRRLVVDVEDDNVDGQAYLDNILSDLEVSATAQGVVLTRDLASLRIRGRDGISLAIIINELVTNALKHGFPDGMPGQISVSFAQDVTAADPTLVVTVADDGVGLPETPGKPGLGGRILDMMVQSLAGKMEIAAARPGAARRGTISRILLPQRVGEAV